MFVFASEKRDWQASIPRLAIPRVAIPRVGSRFPRSECRSWLFFDSPNVAILSGDNELITSCQSDTAVSFAHKFSLQFAVHSRSCAVRPV